MDRIVSYEEVIEIPKNPNTYFIDIREGSEIKVTGLIPGSIHIPMGEVEKELIQSDKQEFKEKYNMEKPKLDSFIILTCRSGRRAEIIMNDLEMKGFKNCKYYAGSWLEWESKKSPQ